MLIPFVASNGILWLTLSISVGLSAVVPSALITVVHFEALASITTGSAVGILIGHSYDFIIAGTSRILPRPITPGAFAAAAVLIIGLVLAAALRIHIPALENPAAYPAMFYLGFALIAYGTFEVWTFLPTSLPFVPKLIIAAMLGCVLFVMTFLAPVYTVGEFVNYYNAGFASCVAGWSAGLTSRELKQLFGGDDLKAKAGGSLIKSVVERDVSVVLAAAIAYVVFKATGVNPLLFSLAVGVLGAILAHMFAHAFIDG